MIDKLSPVRNPLTIIAFFSALAEIASTVALATVEKDLQHIFVWFVMFFPTLLVVAFFLTLNFNPRVLYAPSDFTNEEHFIQMLRGTRVELDSLETRLQAAKDEIATKVAKELDAPDEKLLSKVAVVIDRELAPIRAKVGSVRRDISQIADHRNYIASLPYEKPCEKCGAVMTLNHDDETYSCRNCGYWLGA